MSRFEIQNLPLAGLKRVTRKAHSDARGFIARLFCDAELQEAGWIRPIRQINHARTVQSGALRGMHYQRPPHCEMKLVSCIRGEVWDVAVDVRAGSPTFLKWHAERLSEDNHHALLIPEGFAHGLLGGEPSRDMSGRIGVTEAIIVFGRTQDSTGKPLAQAFERIPNAPDLHQIDSHTQNHGAERV